MYEKKPSKRSLWSTNALAGIKSNKIIEDDNRKWWKTFEGNSSIVVAGEPMTQFIFSIHIPVQRTIALRNQLSCVCPVKSFLEKEFHTSEITFGIVIEWEIV